MGRRMRRARVSSYEDLETLVLVLGIAAIAVLTLILIRVQRGLVGMILAIFAVGLFAYWLTELRKTVRKELRPTVPKREWQYELMDAAKEVTLVAEVPGPSEQVKVNLVDNTLEIEGGRGFNRRVALPAKVALSNFSYLNGVLHVKMEKI